MCQLSLFGYQLNELQNGSRKGGGKQEKSRAHRRGDLHFDGHAVRKQPYASVACLRVRVCVSVECVLVETVSVESMWVSVECVSVESVSVESVWVSVE